MADPQVIPAVRDEGDGAWPAGTRFVERVSVHGGDIDLEGYVLQVPLGAALPAEVREAPGFNPKGSLATKLVIVIGALAVVAAWHLTHPFGAWEMAPFAVLAAVLALLLVPESAGYDVGEPARFVLAPALPDEVPVGAAQRLGMWRAPREMAVLALAPGLWWLLGALAGPFSATAGVLGGAVLAWSAADVLRPTGEGDDDAEMDGWRAREMLRIAPRVVRSVSAFVGLACVQILLYRLVAGDSSPLERAIMGVIAALAVFEQELRSRRDDAPKSRLPTRRWLGEKGRVVAAGAAIVSTVLGLAVASPLESMGFKIGGLILLVLACVCFFLAVTGGPDVVVKPAADRLPARGSAGDLPPADPAR